jgi:hypothetical protein
MGQGFVCKLAWLHLQLSYLAVLAKDVRVVSRDRCSRSGRIDVERRRQLQLNIVNRELVVRVDLGYATPPDKGKG